MCLHALYKACAGVNIGTMGQPLKNKNKTLMHIIKQQFISDDKIANLFNSLIYN